jgi:hypothetical protein
VMKATNHDRSGSTTVPGRGGVVGKIIASVNRMMKHTSFLIATGVAIVASVACGNNNGRNNTTANSSAANPSAANQDNDNAARPIAVTGCLQRDGRTFIVTHLNEPSREGVGTTGNGTAVEREQLREAANAYRVESKDQSNWENMVGKQVRVSGSIAKAADLPTPPATAATAGSDRPSATSGNAATATGGGGTTDNTSREKIDKGDLAQISADSMTVIAENCGGDATSGSSAKKPAARSSKRR